MTRLNSNASLDDEAQLRVSAGRKVLLIERVQKKLKAKRCTSADLEWLSRVIGLAPGSISYSLGEQTFEQANWPLALAVAWIANRDKEAAIWQWRVYELLGSSVLIHVFDWTEGFKKLWEKLCSGNIDAVGRKMTDVQPRAIEAFRWSRMHVEHNVKCQFLRYKGDPKSIAFINCEVNKTQLIKLFPAESTKRKLTPKAERDCEAELVRLMRENPASPIAKAVLRTRFPDVSDKGFERAWARALRAADAPAWAKPGRRRKTNAMGPAQISS